MEKKSSSNFDVKAFKEQMNQIKGEYDKAKLENEAKKAQGEPIEKPKQPLGKTIVGVLILVLIVGLVGYVVLNNLDVILLPKNSITLVVVDQDGNAINGLKINIRGNHIYDEEFTDISDITILDAEPGDYILTFEHIPEGYDCSKVVDNFTLKKDGKIKLEYKCTKE